ncbi:P-loop containing nucleoside triphosphate hydrolase protein [Leptodontidium sp. 2 PMI_412]|nr:P-loop containing nucleoside triphosphate hydrolase protein [Leptodontidium sp. 2 PMI_412]
MGKTFKVMVVGEPGVGKTSLVMRVLGMSSGSISSQKYPVATEIWRKVYKSHVMEIHDTHYGSAQDFPCEDLKDMSGFILAFDMSSKDFLYHTRLWLDRIRRATKSEPPIVFIGNKSDKQDAISSSAIRTILERDYFVVSARTSQGVDVAFGRLFDMVLEITPMEDTMSEALQNLTLA